jgi:oligopeptidase B
LLAERTEATTRVAVLDPETADLRYLPADEEVSTVDIGDNREFDTGVVRYDYGSLTTPEATYSYELATGNRALLHRRPVAGGYDSAHYVTRREWATATDGTAVPISVVHHVDTPLDGSAPCLLYGYGSYEISVDPGFSYTRPSLLDRGFVFAVAHIRGGGEMGRRWYEDGKLFAKRNSFSDYIAAADHLVAKRYTCAGRIVARGGSAGGLLMGAVVNARPELFAGVVAQVPFVDVLSTMEDETLPLTVGEFEEWGNPKEAKAYDYIATYSPYDNVGRQPYPRMLVTAGLNDPRVAYWEPAKWVQRLRERSTSDAQIFLRTDLGAGHGGVSGRYDAWREEAEILAFVIETGNTAADRPVVPGASA